MSYQYIDSHQQKLQKDMEKHMNPDAGSLKRILNNLMRYKLNNQMGNLIYLDKGF